MGLCESSLMGCHLKCVEASASIKQNLPGAVTRPPLAVTLEVLSFLSGATLSRVGFQLTGIARKLRLYLEAISFIEQLRTLKVSFVSSIGASPGWVCVVQTLKKT